jgi:serine/threonine protein kinase
MPNPHVRRNPRRKSGITFEFGSNQTNIFQVLAEDASIRAARFPLSERERILNAGPSAKAFFISGIPTVVKHISLLDDPERPKDNSFVITYKSCQYEDGSRLRGNHASYEIIKFIGAGQSAETYKAIVTHISSPVEGLNLNDEVVIKVPLFDPCRREQELIDLSSNLVILFIREEASLRRLASLDCVASFIDTGSHRFPISGIPETRVLIQKYIEGDSLDEYLRIKYSDLQTNKFSGLRQQDFYRLGRDLAEAIRKSTFKIGGSRRYLA